MNQLLVTMLPRFVAMATLFVAGLASAQALTGDVNAGKGKAAMCIGCHGIIGYQNVFPEVHKVPKISGQSAQYIESSLKAYKKGDRKHPTMRGIAGSLSEQDMADLGAFYAQHSAEPAAPEMAVAASDATAALLAKGGCVACHGDNYSKPLDPSYPKLAGQHADYLYVALKSYTIETNANSKLGRNNAIMSGIASQFSLAELKDVSKYLSKLPTEMAVVPQSRFR